MLYKLTSRVGSSDQQHCPPPLFMSLLEARNLRPLPEPTESESASEHDSQVMRKDVKFREAPPS